MESITEAPQKPTMKPFDVQRIRADFPVLMQTVNDCPLVYFDNAATAQKPKSVIASLEHYYSHDNANIHRGVHCLSQRATEAYENARQKMASFINAQDVCEIIFVRGTTEAINLVAQSYGRHFLKTGDEIIITTLEHHSNIVPWQLLSQQTGCQIKVVPVNDAGELLIDEYTKLFSAKTKLVAVGHISNAIGTINPIKQMINIAHAHDALVLIDGAQAAPHVAIDVQALDCDFYALSGHKLFGPTGIGILYAKRALLEKMPPYQGGGEMIKMVSFDKTIYNDVPHKFEAGTPNIADAIGLGAAIDYVSGIGLSSICDYEHDLLIYATDAIQTLPDIKIIGTAALKTSILSFTMGGIHPHDIGTILDHFGIAIRTGHHCAMPLMQRFNLPATARASFAFYNTHAEIDQFINALGKVKEILQR